MRCVVCIISILQPQRLMALLLCCCSQFRSHAIVFCLQATRCVGVGTAAGEQCQQQLRNAQSSVDVLYGRLPHG